MGYRWQIYLVNLDPTVGSEQGKTRPVLVISDDDINAILPVMNILPITSYKQGRSIYPNEVFVNTTESGLDKDSIILCHQIRTIDKKRLIKRIGQIQQDHIKEDIVEALSFQLGLS
ncbi:MAG: type II toxin-antitoxin system PemK/MazF family toxin [Methylovulum miyakonense]|uniref:type II toxin-antitoxin system PemK/MazF family toxin n=1 Tax=Methylovulum miyakonense TaxID=645578 RepID=UPI003BB51501